MKSAARSSSVLLSALALGLGLIGCSAAPSPSGEAVGQASAQIDVVPAGVSCIRVTVAGSSQTVTSLFSVTPSQSTTLPLDNLPVGADTFVADAFAVACPSIATSTPTWVTAPVVANVSASAPFHVVLGFVPNGHGSVTAEFGDGGPDGGGLPNVVSCDDSGCVCAPGFGNCDGTWTNGCEANLDSDPANCGACGNACGEGVCAAASCASGNAGATTEYSPYFPTWVWGSSGYAFTSLADLQAKSGLNDVTIAFVLANGGCNVTQDIAQNASDVQAFIAAGGHVKASFGGSDGIYLENMCPDAPSLAGAIETFVDTTGITDLVFDVVEPAALTDAVNQLRGQALKLAQDARGIQVSFSLSAAPSPNGGLTSQGLSVVSHALGAGVKVSHVTLQTLDYGDAFGGKPLAPVVIGSLTDANTQLVTLDSSLTTAEAWSMLGVEPMIGKNDDSEIFSLDDATTLASFAKSNGLGVVSFWSIDRDQVCPSGASANSCSTVDTTNFEFNSILSAVAR